MPSWTVTPPTACVGSPGTLTVYWMTSFGELSDAFVRSTTFFVGWPSVT